MKPIQRIQTDIEGLEGLLIHALRIRNPKYIRMIGGDIEGLRRELKIQRVKESKR